MAQIDIGENLAVKRGSALSALALVCLSVAGCAAVQKVQQVLSAVPRAEATQKAKPEEPKPSPEAAEAKRQATVEKLELPKFELAVPSKPLPPAAPLDAKKLVHVDEPVSINVESMPLSDLVVHALGGMLKVNLYIDEQVKNMKDPVTIRTGEPLPAYRALEVILGVLESKNLYFEERAGTLFVYRTRPGTPRPAEIRLGQEVPDSPTNILQVVVLKYARPVEIDPLLREFYKTGVAIKIHPRENALILSGQASAIKAMMEFIQIFDVPYVVGKKAFIIKLLYWQPDEFMKQMTQILDGTGFNIARTSRDPGILFIPIKFVNSLLVIAPDDASAKYVLEWKERLDTAESAGTEERAFTYVPEYAKATEIVESIRKLYGVLPPEAPLQPGAPPQAQPSLQAPGARPPTQQPPRTAPGQAAAPVTGPGLKIAADERRNVVLAVTTPSNYKSILVLLKELDTPVKQVLIETTIAEISLTDDLRLGFEFFIKEKVKSGTISLGTLGQLGLRGGLQYAYIAAGENLQALMELLQTDNRANILSRPRLMVLDNQEATIQVGDEVPTVTSEVSATDIGAPSVQRNIQYRRTGLILTIKPTINAKGLLTLDISQEVSDATPTTSSSIDSPTIKTRRIRTSVVAGDGQTVALGGLMRESISRSQTKVPWLGDLPVIGYLFKSESSTKEKTELIVLILPRILSSVDDTTRVTEELKQELRWLK